VKTARFIAPAREEFLAEVAYYNEVQQGTRFVAAVEEATARALAFPLAGSPAAVEYPPSPGQGFSVLDHLSTGARRHRRVRRGTSFAAPRLLAWPNLRRLAPRDSISQRRARFR